MANPCIGNCNCPLCAEAGAEVRRGEKDSIYIVCDACVSMVRTMSRAGRARITALMQPKASDPTPASPPADPAPAPVPKAKAAPKPAPAAQPKPWFAI